MSEDIKISAEDYFKSYNIDPNIDRSDLTDEMATDILIKAAEALNNHKEKLEVIESIKDGAFEVLKILKTAGAIAVLLA